MGPQTLSHGCIFSSLQITKFQSVSEIPSRFIERNVSLRGKVHSITERGIKVEHVPIYLPILSPLLSKHKGNVGGSFEEYHVYRFTGNVCHSNPTHQQSQFISVMCLKTEKVKPPNMEFAIP